MLLTSLFFRSLQTPPHALPLLPQTIANGPALFFAPSSSVVYSHHMGRVILNEHLMYLGMTLT